MRNDIIKVLYIILFTLYFSMVAGAYIAYLDSVQNNNNYTNREK